MIEAHVFTEIGSIMILCTILAFIAQSCKQPLIPAYILAGFIIGPLLNIIGEPEIIATLSEIGIAFLLFIVGMEIDIRKLWNVGHVSIVGGLTQVFLLSGLTFLLASFFGFSGLVAIYLGLIVALSSTMVVIKLLADKNEIDTLHARIIIGILLVQDVIAILALTVFSTIDAFSFATLGISILKGVSMLGVALLCGRYVFPTLFRLSASSQELLFMMSVSAALLFALLFSAVGFSIAIGAFIAGVSLAHLPYNLEVVSKIKPLRDFFAVLFFVSLGMQVTLDIFSTLLLPLIVFTIVVLMVKPILTMIITSLYGYKKRTSFMTSVSLGQVSEFSLIIVAQGVLLGHLNETILSLTVFLTVITIFATSYSFSYAESLFKWFGPYLNVFERLTKEYDELEYTLPKANKHAVVCGYNRIGYSVLEKLMNMKKEVFVIDYNPEVINHLIRENIPCTYGDVCDDEILERAHLSQASILISTIPGKQDNLRLLKKAKSDNPNMLVFLTANQIEDGLQFYALGADYVILPHILGGEHVSTLLDEIKTSAHKISHRRNQHITHLHQHHTFKKKHTRHYHAISRPHHTPA